MDWIRAVAGGWVGTILPGRRRNCASAACACLLGAFALAWASSCAGAGFDPLPVPDDESAFADPIAEGPSDLIKPVPQPEPPVPPTSDSLFEPASPAPGPAFGYVPVDPAPRTWLVAAPYAWLTMMHGTVTAFGQSRSVDVDINDVADRVRDANGAMQFHIEGGRGRWGAIFDTTILKLTPTLSVPGGHDNLDLRQTFLEFLGMYRLVDTPTGWATNQRLSVDFLLGGRYYSVMNGITFVPFDTTKPAVPLEQTQTWVDLVIGGRASAPLAPGLDAFVRGDIGGFGMGTSSTKAWNVVAGLDWQFFSGWSVLTGYRVFAIEKSQGAGATQFAFDAKLQGPFLALAVRF